MKKLLLFLFTALFAFVGAFALSQYLEKQSEGFTSECGREFVPASYALKNRPFTIVIVGYNNGAYVEKTLLSVFSQCYDNFRLVYIDDCSDDGSFDVARDYIYESDYLAQVTLVRNESHLGNLANIFAAVRACADDEIVIPLQGEDWLSHEWVLQRLNAYYDDPNLWIALAQGIDYPTYHFPQEPNLLEGRSAARLESHLMSFYASLFKKVPESDFVYSGTFLRAEAERAYMTPMLEMGAKHFHFIREVLSVNNRERPREENREWMQIADKFIRSLEPYPPLKDLKVITCGE